MRVLTRVMERISAIAGDAGAQLGDRRRSVKLRILEMGRAARSKAGTGKEKLQQGYWKLWQATSRVVGQAKGFSREMAGGVKKSAAVLKPAAREGLRKKLATMAPRGPPVMRPARARVLGGNTHVEHQLVSVLEPTTEVIRKGKASKPSEFGQRGKIQEAESDHPCVGGLCDPTQRFDAFDSGHRIPPAAMGVRPARGGG